MNGGNSSGNGVLHAYDASDLGNELYNSNQASGKRDFFLDNKFITPDHCQRQGVRGDAEQRGCVGIAAVIDEVGVDCVLARRLMQSRPAGAVRGRKPSGGWIRADRGEICHSSYGNLPQ